MSRIVKVRDVEIGGGNPISIQSMCNTKTSDVEATVRQIGELEKAGCEIVRVAVPDQGSVSALEEIRSKISIPLVADIHFDWRLAVAAAPFVDKLRINPGNIKSHIKEVVEAAKSNGIPIRVGINLGSLDPEIQNKFGRTAKGMIESARKQIKTLEDLGFKDIIVSLKASDIPVTLEACRIFAKEFEYPQHIGITESGTNFSGTVKSSIGLGILLSEGIGDTIRVSLSGDPVKEIKTAREILKHLGLRAGVSVTACPTCARVGMDVEEIANKIEDMTRQMKTKKHIAVMGCVVNGPGEAADADIAVVGAGEKDPLLYVGGKLVSSISKDLILTKIEEELRK